MSESPKSPFTMVGAQDAAVCVDGVCEAPLVREAVAHESVSGAEPANKQSLQQPQSAPNPQV